MTYTDIEDKATRVVFLHAGEPVLRIAFDEWCNPLAYDLSGSMMDRPLHDRIATLQEMRAEMNARRSGLPSDWCIDYLDGIIDMIIAQQVQQQAVTN